MLKIIFLLCAFTLVLSSKPTILYSIVSRHPIQAVQTSVAQLDPETGNVVSLLDAAANMTLPGLSAYDTKQHEYYYASADDSDFIFRADLLRHKLDNVLSPSEVIYSFSYDNVQQRVIVACSTSDGISLYSVTWDSTSATYLTTLKIDPSATFFRGAISADLQRYHYILMMPANDTEYYIYDNYVSLTNPADTKSAEIGCAGVGFWPSAYAFDTIEHISYVLGYYMQNGESTYAIAWDDFNTGKCGLNFIDMDPAASVTAIAYDPNTQIAYASATINKRSVLYHIYLPASELIKVVKVDPKYVVQSLEIGN